MDQFFIYNYTMTYLLIQEDIGATFSWTSLPHYCTVVRGIYVSPAVFPHIGLVKETFGCFVVVKLNKLLNK